mmetsp:Transcript_136423/g.235600  ORF Transcript_136423/g.235600 Transcript_136423/m.235600 type:complete len:165 (+) Transcript_136423:1596-2090(+)
MACVTPSCMKADSNSPLLMAGSSGATVHWHMQAMSVTASSGPLDITTATTLWLSMPRRLRANSHARKARRSEWLRGLSPCTVLQIAGASAVERQSTKKLGNFTFLAHTTSCTLLSGKLMLLASEMNILSSQGNRRNRRRLFLVLLQWQQLAFYQRVQHTGKLLN